MLQLNPALPRCVVSGPGWEGRIGKGVANFIIEGGSNTVAGNLIGLDATGMTALGNGNGGVIDEGFGNNVIGGATAAARNYIAGNANRGIKLTIDHTSDAAPTLVRSNFATKPLSVPLIFR